MIFVKVANPKADEFILNEASEMTPELASTVTFAISGMTSWNRSDQKPVALNETVLAFVWPPNSASTKKNTHAASLLFFDIQGSH